MNFRLIPFLAVVVCLPAYSWNQTGIASWYGGIFHGRLTANGEIYDTYGYTCAHKTLPFGTVLNVKNLKNDAVVQVRVNDRGPFADDRIIDLTYAAAKKLDMIRDGTAPVYIEAVDGDLPEMRFKVRIGAWRDLENARQHRKRLEDVGLRPNAELNDSGITSLSVDEVPEADVVELVTLLESMGYADLLITQVMY